MLTHIKSGALLVSPSRDVLDAAKRYPEARARPREFVFKPRRKRKNSTPGFRRRKGGLRSMLEIPGEVSCDLDLL